VNQWLRELRRRRRAPGRRPPKPGARWPSRPGSRWLGWARSLAARRRRTAGRRSFAGIVLLRGSASAAGGVTRLPTVSRAWRLHLTLRPAPGPAAPASGGRRGALPVPLVQPVARAAASARRALANPAAAADRSTVVAQARLGGTHVAGERRRTVRLASAGGVPAGEPFTAAGRAVTGDIMTAAVRHTVQRVLERGRRVEERTAAPDPASGLAGYPHRPDIGWTPGPPPMAAARPPQSPAREHGRGAADAPGPGGPGARRTPDAPQAPPRIDMEQLADQVVRRIDDRIIAHRERLGRI
jgi:hypothetical protein